MAENKKNPTGAGKNSFDLIDTEKFFQQLDLQKGISFTALGTDPKPPTTIMARDL